MIDFTGCAIKNKCFGGANGKKLAIEYQGETYMLKFPTTTKLNKDMHYTNGCFSEYLGCHIFNEIGIKAQETLLGTYKTGTGVKTVVACKDFTDVGIIAQDFASLKNRIIDSERNGYGTELSDILFTIEEQSAVPAQKLMEYFWDIFIVDALIGNWDRHNGNWGFLYHQQTDMLELSPVYDCGSSLYPQADERMMHDILNDRNEMKRRIFERPASSIQINGKKINYYNFLSSCEYEECNHAVIRIVPRISLHNINHIVEQTEGVSELHKLFLKTMLKNRYDIILKPAYEKAKNIMAVQDKEHDDLMDIQNVNDNLDSDDFTGIEY